MSESTAKTKTSVDNVVEQEVDRKGGKDHVAAPPTKEKRKRRSRWGAAPGSYGGWGIGMMFTFSWRWGS